MLIKHYMIMITLMKIILNLKNSLIYIYKIILLFNILLEIQKL